jgi:hypothetical protein
MTYLVFDENNELFDVLEFKTSEEVEKYKEANPTMIVKEDSEFLFLETDDLMNDDGDDDLV